MLISLLRFNTAHSAVLKQPAVNWYVLQSKVGVDTLNICLLCHASRQGASLFAVHPLIYQMSTIRLGWSYKEQFSSTAGSPRKGYLKESDTSKSKKTLHVLAYTFTSGHQVDLFFGSLTSLNITS